MIDHIQNSDLVGSPFKNLFSWEELQLKLADLQENLKDVNACKSGAGHVHFIQRSILEREPLAKTNFNNVISLQS